MDVLEKQITNLRSKKALIFLLIPPTLEEPAYLFTGTINGLLSKNFAGQRGDGLDINDGIHEGRWAKGVAQEDNRATGSGLEPFVPPPIPQSKAFFALPDDFPPL